MPVLKFEFVQVFVNKMGMNMIFCLGYDSIYSVLWLVVGYLVELLRMNY